MEVCECVCMCVCVCVCVYVHVIGKLGWVGYMCVCECLPMRFPYALPWD